ncbi:hypothetical protein [Flammeovirga aprica]|uniref:hypothetical protein n=1 Tax=Flammeovirga aprica TaxID=29528 RepID=UPI0019817126|nr:hypothetical protein [Flammeovirga aprica]
MNFFKTVLRLHFYIKKENLIGSDKKVLLQCLIIFFVIAYGFLFSSVLYFKSIYYNVLFYYLNLFVIITPTFYQFFPAYKKKEQYILPHFPCSYKSRIIIDFFVNVLNEIYLYVFIFLFVIISFYKFNLSHIVYLFFSYCVSIVLRFFINIYSFSGFKFNFSLINSFSLRFLFGSKKNHKALSLAILIKFLSVLIIILFYKYSKIDDAYTYLIWIFLSNLIYSTYFFGNTWGFLKSVFLSVSVRKRYLFSLLIIQLKMMFTVLIVDFIFTYVLVLVYMPELSIRYFVSYLLITLSNVFISLYGSLIRPQNVMKIIGKSQAVNPLVSYMLLFNSFIISFYDKFNNIIYIYIVFNVLIIILLTMKVISGKNIKHTFYENVA